MSIGLILDRETLSYLEACHNVIHPEVHLVIFEDENVRRAFVEHAEDSSSPVTCIDPTRGHTGRWGTRRNAKKVGNQSFGAVMLCVMTEDIRQGWKPHPLIQIAREFRVG